MSSPRSRFSLRHRSVYFWLNVGFVVVVLGMVFGFGDQGWYFLVALAWLIVGTVQTMRTRRNQPQSPSLFEDDGEKSRARNDG